MFVSGVIATALLVTLVVAGVLVGFALMWVDKYHSRFREHH